MIREKTNRIMKSGNASFHSVQKLLTHCLQSENVKITIYENIIFPGVLYGCENWYRSLRAMFGLRVFEERALRKIF
jgi:hypothetical protein